MNIDQEWEEVVARSTSAVIHYPHFKKIHKDIRRCQHISKISGEPQCMSLEGVTGAGKSTLLEAYAEAFPPYETPEGTMFQVFYSETPKPVTVGGLAETLLQKLGDPAASRGTVASKSYRLTEFIKACQVELVVLDDFHHLIDSNTTRVLSTVSDWLKVLIKETKVPFLVVGISGQVETILKANAQLSRLFPVRETLPGFEWTKKGIKEYRNFIKVAEKVIDIPIDWNPNNEVDLLTRIHFVTDGVVGHTMSLLRNAAWTVVENGQDKIDMATLHFVFDEYMKHLEGKSNPFVEGWDRSKAEIKPVDKPDAVGNRSKRRKEKKPKPNDVLKTK